MGGWGAGRGGGEEVPGGGGGGGGKEGGGMLVTCVFTRGATSSLPVQSKVDYGDRRRIEAAMHRAGLGGLASIGS